MKGAQIGDIHKLQPTGLADGLSGETESRDSRMTPTCGWNNAKSVVVPTIKGALEGKWGFIFGHTRDQFTYLPH